MSLNKVMLIGHLGSKPTIRAFPDGTLVATLSLATNRHWTNQQGEKQQDTTWHRIQLFGKLAEIAERYLQSGAHLYIEGRIRTNKWQDQKTGEDRYAQEIVGEQMRFLDSKSQENAPVNDIDDEMPF